MTLNSNSKLKDTITSEERNCMRKEKALYLSAFHGTSSCFLNKGTHISILHWTRQILHPTLKGSLGWRGARIISHGRKRKGIWKREHLVICSNTALQQFSCWGWVGTRFVMPAFLPTEGQGIQEMAHLWSLPSFLSVFRLGIENRHWTWRLTW